MPPKTTYKNNLLTSPNLSSTSKYLQPTTYKVGAGAGGGGGGSWGPTKPTTPVGTNANLWSSTPTNDSSKLTVGGTQNPLAKPSPAWQEAMSGMSIGADGKVVIGPKKPTVTPTNPSNTGTTGTTLTPAGKTYAERLAEITKGAQDVQTAFNEYKAGSSNGGKSTPEEDYKNSAEYKAYLKYMREQQNPTEANNTAKERADALKVLADVQKRKEEADLEARRRYEEILDKSGGLKAGAEQSAALDRRRSNQELADLALQESAAARTAGVYDDIYQKEQTANRPLTIEEATTLGVPFGTTMSQATAMGKIPSATGSADGFSLGKDQTRWEYDATTGQYKQVAAGSEASGEGGAGSISPYQQERITRNLASIDDLSTRVGPWTTGFGALLDVIPSSDARDFQADLAMLKSNIAFGELTAMREASKTGGALGAISEKELALLEAALGSLDTKQSAANFQKNLEKIKESINRWVTAANQYGGATGGEVVTLPDGTTINTNW